MADAKQVITQLRDLWTKLPRRKKTIAMLVLAGVLGYSYFMPHADPWTVVGEGVSPEDAQELASALAGRGVPARIRDGKVEVASERVDEARAIASSSGLLRPAKGYEIFDENSLGKSSFAEQVNFKRALQGELARSIMAMAQVEGARVHLALGRRSVFKDQDEAPSASVALHLHAAQTLTSEQVRGVRQLVAASVDGLKADAVVVVDNHGNLLDSGEPSSSDKKADLERTLTGRVRAMLERVVGAGKVSVVTTAVVDDRKVSETQEVYDQEHPALRSESRTVEGIDATQAIGGLAGTRGNLPGAPAAAPAPGMGSNGRLQETKNYEVGRTVRQITKPDVQLSKLHLAIVVDYKTGADGKPAPRTEKELGELAALARQAAGIDEARGDKIEMRSIPFAPDPESSFTPAAAAGKLPLVPIAIGGGALLLVLTFLMTRKRGRSSKGATLALPANVSELERVLEARQSERARAAMPAPSEAPGLPPGKPVRDRVLAAVTGDVERAAEVLTAWLSEAPKGAK